MNPVQTILKPMLVPARDRSPDTSSLDAVYSNDTLSECTQVKTRLAVNTPHLTAACSLSSFDTIQCVHSMAYNTIVVQRHLLTHSELYDNIVQTYGEAAYAWDRSGVA
jgi:hypothetical protein